MEDSKIAHLLATASAYAGLSMASLFLMTGIVVAGVNAGSYLPSAQGLGSAAVILAQATGTVSATASSGSCPAITQTLARGSRDINTGAQVSTLQNFLISSGFLANGNVTGYFGPLTESAVQNFQASNGVVSSGSAASTGWGSVGPRTRATMTSSCTGAASSNTNTNPAQTQNTVAPQAVQPAVTTAVAPAPLGVKPNTAQFAAGAHTDAATASTILYGVIGSNTDMRDWAAIMSSSNPLSAARAATAALYNSGRTDYLAAGATRPADRSTTVWAYTSGNFTFYKELLPAGQVNYVLALVDANGFQLTSAANPDALAKLIVNFGFNKSDLSGLQAQLDGAGINLSTIGSWPRGFISGTATAPAPVTTSTASSTTTHTTTTTTTSTGNDSGSSVSTASGSTSSGSTATGTKPNSAQFAAAAHTDASTASTMLYGVIGSNTDLRDWGAIMSSSDPLGAARAATAAMYNSGSTAYLAAGATRPANRPNTTILAAAGNFAFYKEILSGGAVNYVLAIVDSNGYQLTSATNSSTLKTLILNFGFSSGDLGGMQSQLDGQGINLQSITSWPRGFL